MTTNLKASRYKKGLTYLKNRIATNKKNTVDSQRTKKKKTKHNTKGKSSNHKGKREKKCKVNGKTRFKMATNTLLLFSHQVMSDSFVTPWIVVHQAPLSAGSSQARMLEWVAISFPRRSS